MQKELTRQLGQHQFQSLPERTDYEYPYTHQFQLERPPQLAPTNSFWAPEDPIERELQAVSKHWTQTETTWKLIEVTSVVPSIEYTTLMQLSIRFEQK